MIDLNHKKSVAIFTFLYRPSLSHEQEISIKHLNYFLARYDKFACVPKGSGYSLPGFKILEFDPAYFKSVKDNARLLMAEELFRAFSDYEYILQYELDALVFSDNLDYWCGLGYDYIGAPWIKSLMLKPYNYPTDSVGNSGLSLKRVSAFLEILKGAKHPWKCILREFSSPSNLGGPAYRTGRGGRRLGVMEFIIKSFDIWRQAKGRSPLIEDRFWAWKGHLYNPDFKIAPVELASKFSFEINPRYLFEKNNRKLPFGAHAWARYDRAFWEPFLLKN